MHGRLARRYDMCRVKISSNCKIILKQNNNFRKKYIKTYKRSHLLFLSLIQICKKKIHKHVKLSRAEHGFYNSIFKSLYLTKHIVVIWRFQVIRVWTRWWISIW